MVEQIKQYIREHNACCGLDRMMRHVEIYGLEAIRRQQRIDKKASVYDKNREDYGRI